MIEFQFSLRKLHARGENKTITLLKGAFRISEGEIFLFPSDKRKLFMTAHVHTFVRRKSTWNEKKTFN